MDIADDIGVAMSKKNVFMLPLLTATANNKLEASQRYSLYSQSRRGERAISFAPFRFFEILNGPAAGIPALNEL